MLAQHLVTRPIFEALFEGYNFGANNPVAQTMERMLAVLDEHALDAENTTLQSFYDSVRRRVAGVDNAEGKQRILVELYDKFFATAFKETVAKLGIVYTPVEIVDFILRSADQVLRAEFGHGLTDEGVHVLDGFTGTGTFLVRLLQTGLIEPHDLARKYARELHGNEILLLAYYIAAVNIETTFQELTNAVVPFPGLILADTFQSWEDDDRLDYEIFRDNNARLERLKSLPIRVIVGNPPYSVGQESGNDDNANESYANLDASIERTYVAQSTATSRRTLYDSYIRAIKWATQRIPDRGVVAYVTNGGWLDSNTADGMRKTLANEFSAIYVYNLRGNQRTAGEQSRKEGGKVFGGGSRATVAITLLVKNAAKVGPATIHYADIGDYLTREQKLDKVRAAGGVNGVVFTTVPFNNHGDWLSQRRDDFRLFLPIASRDRSEAAIFESSSLGLASGRDAWTYNSSLAELRHNVTRMAANYNEELARKEHDPSYQPTPDREKVSWNRNLFADFGRGRALHTTEAGFRLSAYRPFLRQHVYFDRAMNAMTYRLPSLFPTAAAANVGFSLTGPSSHFDFCCIAAQYLPDLHLLDTGQFFPRWRYEPVDNSGTLDLGDHGEVVDGYRKIDNITGEALRKFTGAYPSETITTDDVFYYTYGLLHSAEYRQTYAVDLKKMLPRIPFVDDFRGYVDAGRRLADLHLGYETVTPHPLDGLDAAPPSGADPFEFYRVRKMRPLKKGERGSIVYNDHITVAGIPDDSYRYMLGPRSAIEWIMDRYQIKVDKPSRIGNDPNAWSLEIGDPRFVLDLLARVVTVSLETVKVVDALPRLAIIGQPQSGRPAPEPAG